jgi:hypothetical protein
MFCGNQPRFKKNRCVDSRLVLLANNLISNEIQVWSVVLFCSQSTTIQKKQKCGRLAGFSANRPQIKKNKSVVDRLVWLPIDHSSKKTQVWSIDSFGYKSTTNPIRPLI